MKRGTTPLLFLSLLAPLVAISSPALAARPAVGRACHHKYSYRSDCKRIPAHSHGNLHVPTYKLKKAAVAIRTAGTPLDLAIALTPCPGSPPRHAYCFRVLIFNDNSGQQITRPPNGLTVQGPYPVYYYNQFRNRYTRLSNRMSSVTGIFAIIVP